MFVEVVMPGTCGELVQGVMGGVNFHITCPIDRYSKVRVSEDKSGTISVPNGFTKTESAVKKVLDIVGEGRGIAVDIKSDLPMAKGMASSTADIVGAVIGTFKLFDRKATNDEIAEISLSVEPTDGTIFDGIVAFDHINGKFFESMGEAPPIEIIVLEPPETLDTLALNGMRDAVKNIDELFFREAYEMAKEGIRGMNLKLLGEAATLSSILNQKVLYKPVLDDVINISRRKGGLGVNVAHSGTVIGIISEEGYGERLFGKIAHYVPGNWGAYIVNLIGGGPKDIWSSSIINPGSPVLPRA